jgi:hypothetical protein
MVYFHKLGLFWAIKILNSVCRTAFEISGGKTGPKIVLLLPEF